LIYSSETLHPSLKIANCREYLETDAGLLVSMRNCNLVHSDLSANKRKWGGVNSNFQLQVEAPY
jgi:hypothetical protein